MSFAQSCFVQFCSLSFVLFYERPLKAPLLLKDSGLHLYFCNRGGNLQFHQPSTLNQSDRSWKSCLLTKPQSQTASHFKRRKEMQWCWIRNPRFVTQCTHFRLKFCRFSPISMDLMTMSDQEILVGNVPLTQMQSDEVLYPGKGWKLLIGL